MTALAPPQYSTETATPAELRQRRHKQSSDIPYSLSALALGLLFGLSAPGWEQWYIAWFAMAPFLLLALRSSEPSQAAFRGFLFGTGYNLMYLLWTHNVRDIYWVGALSDYPLLLRNACWILLSTWQGLYVGIFACVVRAIPMTGGFLPAKSEKGWLLPSFFFIPLLWCLVIEKLGNMTALLGVPWSMIQYSQYKQLPIIQSASIFGGIGLAYIIVLSNLAIATLLNQWRPLRSGNWLASALSFRSRSSLVFQSTAALLVIACVPLVGSFVMQNEIACASNDKTLRVSAAQSALSPKIHNVSDLTIASKYMDLSAQSGSGLLVFPEWAFFTNASDGTFLSTLGALAKQRQQAWIVGLLDEVSPGKVFNAVSAVREDGKLIPETYHKNFLVPFGEYLPGWTKDSIVGQLLFPRETIEQTESGHSTTVFNLDRYKVGVIVCFENLLPELCAKNTRDGADILVDCSNTVWFHNSILSDQMVAFCVMRAVENRRSFVFATTMGPSTIIDPTGRILAQTPREEPATISAEVPIKKVITPFSRICF